MSRDTPTGPKDYTTGQIARLCKVAPRTVAHWFDAGRLQGYRIPGSRDRRVPREHLVEFLRANGMPLRGLDGGDDCKVLIVGDSGPAQQARRQLADLPAHFAGDAFEAGRLLQAMDMRPDLVVIDLGMGRSDGLRIARAVRERGDAARLIALANEDETEALEAYGFQETFRKPFDVAVLVERVKALAAGR